LEKKETKPTKEGEYKETQQKVFGSKELKNEGDEKAKKIHRGVRKEYRKDSRSLTR
jgi:hypothetical protein